MAHWLPLDGDDPFWWCGERQAVVDALVRFIEAHEPRPRSGYLPDDPPAFEAWVGRPIAHGDAHFELACQLPVRKV